MIELRNITKSYGEQEVIRNLTISFPPEEIGVLIGPSGCGKTTTLEMINGLTKPDSGEILVDNEKVASTDIIALRRRIGYAIQEVGLFPHYTVFENIVIVPRILKWDMAKINKRVEELLSLVNLKNEMLEKLPHQLSGGQQQRVGVARALAADPKYLLMDEPFGALDPINRAHLQDEFLRIQEKLKKTVIFVTHDMDEALKVGNRIAVMNKGEIMQFDTPMNLIKNPAADFVKNLIGFQGILKTLPHLTVGDLPQEYLKNSAAQAEDKFQPVLTADTSLHAALEKLLISDYSALPVKNKNNEVIGHISLQAFQAFLRSRKI